VVEGKFERADVVMIASVPTLRFDDRDYENLARSVNEGGIVMGLGDTHPNLNKNKMEKFFDFHNGGHEFRNYWIKK
ncbi:MAG: hypothetical protein AAB859_00560, partial [Patescibacteria group bacterium]